MPGNSQKPNPFIVIDEQYRAAFLAEEKRFEMQAYHIINNQLKIEFESKEKGKRQEMLALVMEETLKKHEEVKDSIDIHLQSVKDSIVKLISDEPPVASSPLFPVTSPEPFPAPQCESQIPGSPVPTVLEGSQTSSPSFHSRLNPCTSVSSLSRE